MTAVTDAYLARQRVKAAPLHAGCAHALGLCRFVRPAASADSDAPAGAA